MVDGLLRTLEFGSDFGTAGEVDAELLSAASCVNKVAVQEPAIFGHRRL